MCGFDCTCVHVCMCMCMGVRVYVYACFILGRGNIRTECKIEKIEMKNQKKEKRKESVCVESKLGRELCGFGCACACIVCV